MTDKTPVTEAGLRQFDHLPAAEAVVRAWVDTGPRSNWHQAARKQVRNLMPLLVRAVERLAQSGNQRTLTDYEAEQMNIWGPCSVCGGPMTGRQVVSAETTSQSVSVLTNMECLWSGSSHNDSSPHRRGPLAEG